MGQFFHVRLVAVVEPLDVRGFPVHVDGQYSPEPIPEGKPSNERSRRLQRKYRPKKFADLGRRWGFHRDFRVRPYTVTGRDNNSVPHL